MPFKTSTKSEKLVVVRGANRVKTLFLRRDVFIEIWFLNINWTQNLIFRKILSPQNEFSNSILSKSARRKNSRFKNWSICRKKLHFKIQFFFQKSPFQNLISNEKVYFKIMPFKKSTKSEKFVVFRGGNQIKTLFLRCDVLIEIWFLNKNWTQNLFFGNYFFLHKFIIQNVLFSKSAGTKNSQLKTWHFGNFSYQIFIVQENVCFRIWFLFFWKFLFKLWFSMKNFATKSCLLKRARKVKNLLFCAEEIKSKRYFLDVMYWSKSDSSIKIELKIYFSEITFFSTNLLFKMFCFRNLPERKTLNWKPDIFEIILFKFSLYRKTFASESDSFFRRISFQTLIFNERVCYKVMPFKMSRQSVNFSSKPDFSIKIEFKNWVSEKYFISRIWLFEMFCIRNLPDRKILNSKPDILEFLLFKFSLCRKTFASESDSFFSENFISNSDFQWKICYEVMLFKMSTQSEKVVVGRGANRVKTFFFQMWIFYRNLISQ